jgi:DNA-binding NtrC family response regulator
MTLILQRAGYVTYSAANGREALTCLRDDRFDLLFLDLKMPGKAGMDLLPDIRLLDPDLPVLILTANASLDVAVEALKMGAYGYLLKPVEPEQILSRVQEIFQEQNQKKRRMQIVNEIKGIITELNEMEI